MTKEEKEVQFAAALMAAFVQSGDMRKGISDLTAKKKKKEKDKDKSDLINEYDEAVAVVRLYVDALMKEF